MLHLLNAYIPSLWVFCFVSISIHSIYFPIAGVENFDANNSAPEEPEEWSSSQIFNHVIYAQIIDINGQMRKS